MDMKQAVEGGLKLRVQALKAEPNSSDSGFIAH